jgi:hypothetical protein
MTKAAQLTIEVHYVALPAIEIQERKVHLCLLLCRGISRWLKDHEALPSNSEPLMLSVPQSE